MFQRYDENIRMIDKQREVISAYSVRLSERGWIFPYHIVEKGKTIVLYGAGKIGKCYYSQLIDSQYCKEVIWVDQRYEEYVALGEPVRSVEIISTLEFDYVFLAIKDSEVQKQIKGWLLKVFVRSRSGVMRIVKRVSLKLMIIGQQIDDGETIWTDAFSP